MHTISLISALTASRIASLQKGAGTKIKLALASRASTASSTLSKTGRLMCDDPPFPGVTPPTIFVP